MSHFIPISSNMRKGDRLKMFLLILDTSNDPTYFEFIRERGLTFLHNGPRITFNVHKRKTLPNTQKDGLQACMLFYNKSRPHIRPTTSFI